MRANDFILEQPTTTTNPQGVTTTVNKPSNRVTTRSDMGTVTKDRSGVMRGVQTPKVGGLQAKKHSDPILLLVINKQHTDRKWCFN